jgi:hypothetical protein
MLIADTYSLAPQDVVGGRFGTVAMSQMTIAASTARTLDVSADARNHCDRRLRRVGKWSTATGADALT